MSDDFQDITVIAYPEQAQVLDVSRSHAKSGSGLTTTRR
jgi:hypothetical protein